MNRFSCLPLYLKIPFVLGLGGLFLLLRPFGRSQPILGVQFRDVSKQAGITPLILCGTPQKNYILEINGSGCAWFDYDNDGSLDLYIVNGSSIRQLKNPAPTKESPRNYLFHNNGNGTFTDVTVSAGAQGGRWGQGVAAADYDNDGFVDLFVTNFGPNLLYRNNGDGTFSDASRSAGVSGGTLWGVGAAFADYDRDGDLDLYVVGYIDFDIYHPPSPRQPQCQYRGTTIGACGPRGLKGAPDKLFRNNGDGTFTDVTAAAGVTDQGLRYGFSVAFEDFNGDEWPDIFVANDSTPNYLYLNQGDGTFEEVAVMVGVAYNQEGLEQSDMGIAVGDVDNDGWTDLFVTTFSDDNYTLFHNDGEALFTDISYPSGLGEPTIPFLGWATFFLDYNNDGWKDLFCVNGHLYPEVDELFPDMSYRQPSQLFANTGNGRFREVSAEVGLRSLPLRSGRGAAVGDYDNDGDPDICIVNIDDRPTLLRNDGGNQGHWLQIKTVGTVSNRDGIGARVKVVAGSKTQYDRVRTGGSYLSTSDIRLRFGLGDQGKADLVEIHWPSGNVDRITDVPANQLLVVQEGKTRTKPAIPAPEHGNPDSGAGK